MKKRKIVGSAIIGNIVEYYDFGLYAVFAPIIGSLFFPKTGDELTQTLLAFSVFAIGFFMRPLGGIFFGHIGDKIGRKAALTTSILGMALCTFCIGLLPSYEQVGILAPILLVIIRLFQGLCVGGEGAAVAIFVLEHMEGYRPGLIGSIVMASNMVGTLLATFIGLGMVHFSGGDLAQCWRYAFFMGGLMGMIGLYMRHNLNETPSFEAKKKSNLIVKHPLISAIVRQWPSMLLVMFLGAVTSAVAYTIRGYLSVFFLQVMLYTQSEALYFTSIALFTMIVLLPLSGIVADKVGYRHFFNTVTCITILAIVPIYGLLANEAHSIPQVLIGIFCLGALSAAICGPAYPYAIKSFEVELRFSGVASSWNLGIALFGGTTPAISAYLSEKFGPIAPSFYIIAICISFLLTKFLTRNAIKN